jgi:type I restriction enzyme, S subunit
LKTVALSDLVEIKYGKALKAEDRPDDGAYPVYGSNGIVGTSHESLVTHPTIVIGRKGAVGEAHLAEHGCWPIDTAFYTVPLPEYEFDLRYLLLWFRSIDLKRLAITSTIPGINRDTLGAQRIPLPPLDEQRRIVAILDEVEALRQLRARADARMTEFIPALFNQMFGDPATNPKGWPVVTLAQCTDRIIDCPHSTPEFQASGSICLRTSNLGKGYWIWDDTRYVTPEEFNSRISRSEIVEGDIILSREGTVGIAAIVEPQMTVCMGQRLVQVRADSVSTISEYLLYVLLHKLDPDRIDHEMVGSTSRHFNVKQIREMKISLPPLGLQREFATQAVEARALKTQQALARDRADDAFQSLLHKAFSGNL